MSSTAWFKKVPNANVLPSTEDETMALVGPVVPDWVRLPPELGGREVRVRDAFTAPCPLCKGGEVTHFTLEGNLGVAECGSHGFVWYRK